MNESNTEDWKKVLYDCKIQGESLNHFCSYFNVSKDFRKEDWVNDDYKHFLGAYSVILTRIEDVKCELDQLENMKGRLEEIIKIKYGSMENNSND